MPRNGGRIGPTASFTSGGVWTIQEQYQKRIDNTWRLPSPIISISNTSKPLAYSSNGLQLYIPVNAWSVYQNLPTYLTGLVTTTSINEAASITINVSVAATTAYLLRNASGWDPVDLTGWTLVESGKSYISAYSEIQVYSKTLQPGSYSFDNYSAMYMFASGAVIA